MISWHATGAGNEDGKLWQAAAVAVAAARAVTAAATATSTKAASRK